MGAIFKGFVLFVFGLPTICLGRASNLDWRTTYATEKPTIELQQKIDDAYTRIFKTEGGQYLCYFFDSYQTIAKFTGASTSEAIKIKNLCGSKSLINKLDDPLARREGIEILFVFNVQNDFGLRSWSDLDNHTYLFYTDSTKVTEQSLVARLSHEIAIRLDFVDTFRAATIFYNFTSPSFVEWIFKAKYSTLNACSALHLFGNPLLRVYFNAARASAFENSIYSQSYSIQSEINRSNESCLLRIIDGLPTIEEIPRSIFQESRSVLDFGIASEAQKCAGFAEKTIVDDFKFLMTETISSRGQIKSLCEFFETPSFGFSPSALSDGPAPRIGGGWKPVEPEAKMESISALEKKSQRTLDIKKEKMIGSYSSQLREVLENEIKSKKSINEKSKKPYENR